MTVTQAAKQLGVPMTTLYTRLQKQGITVWKLGNYNLIYDEDAIKVMAKTSKMPKGIAEVYE
jgi:excisionase family DNA binding protein